MALSREQIKDANDTAPEEFPVPEWGDEPLLLAWPNVKAMTAIGDAENIDGVDLLVSCAVDEDGAPLFTEADREWLETKSANVVARVVKRLNEMFGELEGNSESAPVGATSSD